MSPEFVNPNWHVALVHFPLGLLIAGTLIEVFSFLWRRHAFRAAGRWMILVGALSGIPTALTGIYALADVTRMSVDEVTAQLPWNGLAAASPVWQNHDQAHMLRDHVVLQGWGIGVALLVSIVWLGASDKWRNKLHLPLLALLLISMVLTIAGAWHGGEAVYRFGTGVELAQPATMPSLAEAVSEPGAAAEEQPQPKRGIKYYLPPIQVHVAIAGATVALALTAIGLSFRAANSGPPRTEVDHIAAALGPPNEPIAGDEQDRVRRDPRDIGSRVPSARFWLLAFGLGVVAALAGDWVLADYMGTWDPQTLWNQIREPTENQTYPWLSRRTAHVAGGSAIIVLSLLMGLFAWLAPRAKLLLVIFTLLILAAVAAQIWLGVLLMFDTVSGPVTRFN